MVTGPVTVIVMVDAPTANPLLPAFPRGLPRLPRQDKLVIVRQEILDRRPVWDRMRFQVAPKGLLFLQGERMGEEKGLPGVAPGITFSRCHGLVPFALTPLPGLARGGLVIPCRVAGCGRGTRLARGGCPRPPPAAPPGRGGPPRCAPPP